MNYGRLAIAVVIATVVDAAYGFVVYGNMLTSQFTAFPGVFRPADTQTTYMPALLVGLLVGMFAATYIYAKGYEGGSGVQEGARFGALVGIFNAGYVVATTYAVMNIGQQLAASMAVAGLVEWVIVGVAIGVAYKPAAAATARRAASLGASAAG